MSAKANKELVRRLVTELFQEGDMEAIKRYVAPDFVDHGAPPGLPDGHEGIGQVAKMFFSVFPDYETEIVIEVAEGDYVVHLSRSSGTHEGELMGVPPSGEKLEWTELHLVRVEDDQVTEHWSFGDLLPQLSTSATAAGSQ